MKPTMPDGGTRALVLALLQCFCAGVLYGWSALIPALREGFGVSTGQAGMVFSFSIVAFTASILVLPRLPNARRDIRAGSVACLIGAAAFALSAMAPSFPLFLMSFALGGGAACGAIYLICLDVAARVRPARADVLTGFMVAAFGIGSAVFGPLLRFLVAEGWGLDSLLVPVACLAVVAAASFLASGTASAPARTDTRPAETPIPAPGSRALPLIWLGFALGSATGLMVLGLASAIIEDAGGTATLAGVGLATVAIANSAGRLSAGLLAQSAGLRAVLLLAPLLSLAGFAADRLLQSPAGAMLGLTVIAGAYGLVASTYPMLTRTVYGPAAFAGRFSAVFTAWGVAGLVSPWAGGVLADSTGGFGPTMLAGAGVAALSLCVAWAIVRVVPAAR